jgi:hypothetical protein
MASVSSAASVVEEKRAQVVERQSKMEVVKRKVWGKFREDEERKRKLKATRRKIGVNSSCLGPQRPPR